MLSGRTTDGACVLCVLCVNGSQSHTVWRHGGRPVVIQLGPHAGVPCRLELRPIPFDPLGEPPIACANAVAHEIHLRALDELTGHHSCEGCLQRRRVWRSRILLVAPRLLREGSRRHVRAGRLQKQRREVDTVLPGRFRPQYFLTITGVT
jgi:hypothetical protein